MKFDLIVKNGRLVINDEILLGSIGVIDGKIAALIYGSAEVEADQVIDAEGHIVMPGLMDVNIHMREPGLEHKEDFTTGTSTAASGGVTTILDMPNTNPPSTTIERLNAKKALIKHKAVVDYGLHFMGAMDNLDQLKKVENISAVKFFMAGHETTPTTVGDVGVLHQAFSVLASRGIAACIHAENQSIISARMSEFQHRTDFKAYSELRNDTVCEMAVNEVITLARGTGCKIHICHVSTKKEIDAIRRAKEDGVQISCEVVPYHLFLTYNDCERLGAYSKVSPALKSPEDQEALWQAIEEGVADCFSSEHTPHTREDKNKSVWEATAGCPGMQEMLPLLVNAGVSFNTIARMGANNPAKFFGVEHKGRLQLGYDADIVIIDPEKEWVVTNEDLFSKCGWSNYEGWKLKGRPIRTLVRGNTVYQDGKILEVGFGHEVSYSNFK